MKPLAIDLFCGLGGWTDGLLAEGYDVLGFDIENHVYGEHRYPAQLVIQDVLTLHGSQFKDATLIVASPPCQEYSYMAMPWKRGKQIAAALRGEGEFPAGYKGSRTIEDLNRLFNACFRIQREACEAAGRHIPMVVENVRGAEKWVGKAQWNFGSYYLWGDVPALMPIIATRPVMKQGITHRSDGSTNFHGYKSSGMNWSDQSKRGQDFTRIAGEQCARKNPGFRFDGSGKSFQSESVNQHVKVPSASGRCTDVGNGARFTSRDCGLEAAGRKVGGDWFNDNNSPSRQSSSKSKARKMASAMIAKIPLPLSRHIAATYYPKEIAMEVLP